MLLGRSRCVESIVVVGLRHGRSAGQGGFLPGRATRGAGNQQLTPTTIEGVFGQFIFMARGHSFESVLVNFTVTLQDPDPDVFEAVFAFSDPAGEMMTGTIDGVRFVDGAGDWSGSGTWEVTGGTGPYLAYTGGGSFTFSALPDDGSAFTSFEGDVVPSPGVWAGATLGGMMLAARRDRAARRHADTLSYDCASCSGLTPPRSDRAR